MVSSVQVVKTKIKKNTLTVIVLSMAFNRTYEAILWLCICTRNISVLNTFVYLGTHLGTGVP